MLVVHGHAYAIAPGGIETGELHRGSMSAVTERFHELKRDDLLPDQRRVFDAIAASPRGNVPAPFHVLLHSAELADYAQRLGALLRYRTGLPARLSEIAEFEWHVHEREARAAGVPEAAIAAIAAGRRPPLEGDAALVHDFAATFYEKKDVSDELFDRAVERFGKRTVVELTSILGYYSMLAIVLRVFRVRP
jgi:4-carboxymuconolactone decarboxylase